ncbi:MAG: hypothetical protein AAF125_12540 [Chloroflexota bacterium]
MGIGDMIGAVSLAIGMAVAYPAVLLLLNIAFPRTTQRGTERLSRGARLPFILGLVAAVIGGGLSVALLSAGGVLQLIGFIGLLALLSTATVGVAAMARALGTRVAALNERNLLPFMEIVVGGVVLTLTFGFPLVGWFVALPLSVVLGLGVVMTSAFGRRNKPTDETFVQAPAAGD